MMLVTVTVEGADDFERRPSVPQRSCYVRLAATPMRPAIMPAVDLVAGKPQIFEFVEGGVEHVYNGPPLIPGGILKGRRNSPRSAEIEEEVAKIALLFGTKIARSCLARGGAWAGGG